MADDRTGLTVAAPPTCTPILPPIATGTSDRKVLLIGANPIDATPRRALAGRRIRAFRRRRLKPGTTPDRCPHGIGDRSRPST
jgi:hypothetical protein